MLEGKCRIKGEMQTPFQKEHSTKSHFYVSDFHQSDIRRDSIPFPPLRAKKAVPTVTGISA